ncbi:MULTISPECIES: IS701 family transposase [unclassified Streptomyces]|uniref:IS701 family transposase n=1 Tax=unclassified Streptomyces TaxID=2593676 RepID=UPI00381E1263
MSVSSTAALFTRDAIAQFAGDVFASMPRVDQRRWAEVYVRGLLLVEGKKSVRRISEDILVQPAHQSLQQFINQSPWEWEPVRARLVQYIESLSSPQAWVLGRTVIPKRGQRSVGVERRFLPEAGRVVNCQIGSSVSLATQGGNIPVNWRLLLPERWLADPALTQSAYIPDGIVAHPEWRELLAMLIEMQFRWGAAPVPVIGDLRYLEDAGRLIRALADRGMDFALEVNGSLEILDGMPVRDASAGRSGRCAFDRAATALEHFRVLCARRLRSPAAPDRHHPKVVSSTVRLPAGNPASDRVRLLSELSSRGVPTRFWVTSLTEQSIADVMNRIRLQHGSQADLRVLEEDFGLRDFEGRSFRGWHHHMTMVSAAYTFNRIGVEPAIRSA